MFLAAAVRGTVHEFKAGDLWGLSVPGGRPGADGSVSGMYSAVDDWQPRKGARRRGVAADTSVRKVAASAAVRRQAAVTSRPLSRGVGVLQMGGTGRHEAVGDHDESGLGGTLRAH